jgi:hypothetical protein
MLTETELRDFDAFTKAIGRRAVAFPPGFQHGVAQAAAAGTQPIFCLLRAGVADSQPSEVSTTTLNRAASKWACQRLRSNLDIRHTTGTQHISKRIGV